MPEYHWINDDIFTVTDFFTPAECREWIDFAEAIGFAAAPITTGSGPVMRPDIRNNQRVMVDDMPRAHELFRRAKDYLPQVQGDWKLAGINERLRFYRYDEGQQFDWHFDGYFQRESGERSRLTFMVYLNGDFEGGQTSFDDCVIEPEAGMALFFIHEIRHKGEPVRQGRKYVLRTDVMFRR